MKFKEFYHNNLIEEYKRLLIESEEDKSTEKLIQQIIERHKSYDIDYNLIKTNGYLLAIYYYYLVDKKDNFLALKKSNTLEEIATLKQRVLADDMLLDELNELINKETEINRRKSQIAKIESKLLEEEIFLIKTEIMDSKKR